MQIEFIPLLILGGFAAGVVNAVAGGGSIVVYPIMLALGIPPISANATASTVVWPGSASSALGYRHYIKTVPKAYYRVLIPGFIGGLIGAILLARTSNDTFQYIVPWFILGGVLLLLFQPQIHRWLSSGKALRFEHLHPLLITIIMGLLVTALSIYGGYFGAGLGVIMLAFFGITGLKSIHEMNGMKNLMTLSINAVAIAYFVGKGLIAWQVVPFFVIGNIVGGWIGANYSTHLHAIVIRHIVIWSGLAIAAYLFTMQYTNIL